MSLKRMILLSMLLGGWGACLGWLIAEFFFLKENHTSEMAFLLGAGLFAAPVGAGIGAAIGLVNSLTAGSGVGATLRRVAFGAVAGLVCGFLSGVLAQLFYSFCIKTLNMTPGGVVRALSWALMGIGIGIADGLYERNRVKLRNGLVGGLIGGFLGGLCFDPISRALAATGTGMTSRVVGLVIVGLCIAGFIGLVQVVLRQAWLTQIDGFRTGRQIILTQPVSVLGRAEHVTVPFLGNWGKPLELEHALIIRTADGHHAIEDNRSASGTKVNNQPLTGRRTLQHGDTITLGSNFLRFHEKVKSNRDDGPAPSPMPPPLTAPKPPPLTAKPPPPLRTTPSMTTAPPPMPMPIAPPVPPKPVTAPAATVAAASDLCPGCQRKLPAGRVGARYCMLCDITA